MKQAKDFSAMISSFCNDIKSAKKTITIVTGESNCHIYNATSVRDALFKAQEGGVKLRIMAGPAVSVGPVNSAENTNTVLELINREGVEVYRRKGRALMHYRIMDGKRIYMEAPHIAGADSSEREVLRIENDEQTLWARKLEDEFNYQVEKGIAERVYSRDDFLLLHLKKLKELSYMVESQGKSFDFSTKEELMAYL